MPDITKIKVDGEPESSYQLYPRNNEFVERANVQPDWNQNDVSAPDYVKNRTHWTEPEILDVIFQQDDVALYDSSDFLEANQLLVLSEELVVGDTYNVNIDGVDHYVVCYTDDSDVHYLGKDLPDRFMLYGSGSSVKLYLYEFSYGSTVRLTVTHITPSKIHKLDPKYLPNADLELVISDYADETFTARDIKINAGSIEGVCTKLAIGEMPKVIIRSHVTYDPGYSDTEKIYPVYYLFRYAEWLEIKYSEPVRQTGSGELVMSLYTISFSVDGAFKSHSVENYSLSTSTV